MTPWTLLMGFYRRNPYNVNKTHKKPQPYKYAQNERWDSWCIMWPYWQFQRHTTFSYFFMTLHDFMTPNKSSRLVILAGCHYKRMLRWLFSHDWYCECNCGMQFQCTTCSSSHWIRSGLSLNILWQYLTVLFTPILFTYLLIYQIIPCVLFFPFSLSWFWGKTEEFLGRNLFYFFWF